MLDQDKDFHCHCCYLTYSQRAQQMLQERKRKKCKDCCSRSAMEPRDISQARDVLLSLKQSRLEGLPQGAALGQGQMGLGGRIPISSPLRWVAFEGHGIPIPGTPQWDLAPGGLSSYQLEGHPLLASCLPLPLVPPDITSLIKYLHSNPDASLWGNPT